MWLGLSGPYAHSTYLSPNMTAGDLTVAMEITPSLPSPPVRRLPPPVHENAPDCSFETIQVLLLLPVLTSQLLCCSALFQTGFIANGKWLGVRSGA